MLTLLLSLLLTTPPEPPRDDEAEYAAFLERTTRVEGTVPAHWRVTWTEDPAHRAVVSWSTGEPGTSHEVRWDVASRAGALDAYAHVVVAQRNGRFTPGEKDVENGLVTPWYHHVRLADLPADTTIWFTIVSDGVASRELHFRTADPGADEVAFLSGGDSRSGHLDRCRMNALIADLAETDFELTCLVHGGDYVYDGKLWRDWGRWLAHFELTVAASGRVLPIVPARGNHDVGPLYGEVFDLPGAPRDHYWTTRLGDVSVVTLNTEISAAGDQATWLGTELEARRADSRWLITNYHRPMYPAVKPPHRSKAHWAPLFDEHRVDLALESDGHVFKRTVPIRADAADARGTVYLGEGGLGVAQRKPRSDRWYLEAPGRAASAHHVLRVATGLDELRVKTLGMGPLAVEFEPEDYAPVLARGALAAYHAGDDPDASWTTVGFDDSAWRTGVGGFGFGDGDDATVLDWMHHQHARLYVRYELDGAALRGLATPGLAMRFDDGFVAYLNGVEVARGGVEKGNGAAAEGIANHEATRWEYFPLEGLAAAVVDGANVLAIEGHNRTKHSSDFSLDAALITGVPPSSEGRGSGWILDETTIRRHALRWGEEEDGQ